MLVGLREQVNPAGDTGEVRATVPVKPPIGATVMVEVPVAPATIVTLVGLAVTEKSIAAVTVTVTVAECEREPPVPVTVTAKVLTVLPEQFKVEVPEPVTLVGVRVQVRPVAGDMLEVRDTTPLKPLTAVTVTVDVPEPGATKLKLVGLAEIVKSCTVTVTVAEWDNDPLVPVTVTVYVPPDPLHDNVEVWEAPSTILLGVRVHVRPDGETDDVRATVPVNPLTGATVIVEVAAALARTVALVGLAATVKSFTVTVTVAGCDSEPLVPVTVTV